MELSILIPARNEMFLANTVKDILRNMHAQTEIIVVLDGAWAMPTIDQHPQVNVIYLPKSIGQRAATNMAARMARGKYVMKVDAHCAFDKGFDRKMLDAFKVAGDDVTMVPVMRNLHAFDWVCPDGHRRYQSPSGVCKEILAGGVGDALKTCGKETTRDIVWNPKRRPESRSYCFDSEPHFQYFNEYTKRPGFGGDLTETMSLQGSCFMLTRERYWKLNISDESFGSWGSQGIEVACKSWLSGGKVLVNNKTWYAHMFRTQGGDFGFPYEISQADINSAKAKAKKLFFSGKLEGAIHPTSWLLERFWPVPGWTSDQLAELKKAELI